MQKKAFSLLAFSAIAIGAGVGLSSCGAPSTGADYLPDMGVDTRGVEITFWTGFGDTVSGQLNQVIEDFEEATGIVVNHESIQGGYDGLAKQINLSASSDTYPNVAVGYPDHMASYRDSDIIMRLDQFIEHDGDIPATREGTATDPNGEGTFEELPAFDYDDFFSDYKTENETLEYKEDGTGYVLGVPFNKSTEVMVYNATFFENPLIIEAGIKLPETWDEVLTEGKEIISWIKGKDGFGKIIMEDGTVYEDMKDVPTHEDPTHPGTMLTDPILLNLDNVAEDSFYPLSYDSQANFFITAVRQWGGAYTEVDPVTLEGKIVFDNDGAKAALTKLNELYEAHVLGIPASFGESSYCSAHYKVNESLMNVGSSAGVNNCAAAPAFDSKIAPVPYNSADSKFVISQGTNLILFKAHSGDEELNDKQLVASWKLLKYLSQVGNGKFAMLSGYFPTCEMAQQDEGYQEFMNAEPGRGETEAYTLQRYAAQVNNNVYMDEEEAWTKFVDPGFSGSSFIRQRVDTITGQVFIDGKSPEEVIRTIYNDLRDYQ